MNYNAVINIYYGSDETNKNSRHHALSNTSGDRSVGVGYKGIAPQFAPC